MLHARPHFVWVDFMVERDARAFLRHVKREGYQAGIRQISGRTLEDQVWWRRWVVYGTTYSSPGPPCEDASEEPFTEVPRKFCSEWFTEVKEGQDEEGKIQLDPAMPYLGATSPKPSGLFYPRASGRRRLVWAADKALPALHLGSWDDQHPDVLWLLAYGKEGPAARALTAGQAQALLSGRRNRVDEAPEALLAAAPSKLAELAGQWMATEGNRAEPDSRAVGVCRLEWEDEAEATLMRWLEENPPRVGAPDERRVGGKRRKRPVEEEISKALSRLLRHEAGTDDLPVTLQGWVRWEYLLEHDRLSRHDPNLIWKCIEENDKQRFTAREDTEGSWWIAAWSGHTIADCVGPSRSVPDAEVPTLLVHGTYRQYVPSIETQGIVRERRDIHLQDPLVHARRWRKGLEVKVSVDTVRAIELGCHFRVTGNLVWLCSSNIPPDAIISISAWDDLVSGRAAVGDVTRGDRETTEGVWDHNGAELGETTEGRPPITQGIVEAANELATVAAALEPHQTLSVHDDTWEAVIEEKAEASPSPGHEDECDWSGDEPEENVVEAVPAKAEPKEEPEDVEMKDGEAAGSGERPRFKFSRLGSAQIHILQAVAAADLANWTDLKECIKEQDQTAAQKSALLVRLEQLAEIREESRAGALESLKAKREEATHIAEEEAKYQSLLDEECKRLERYNPVGPRRDHHLITDNRLQADIAAGKSIWQSRRDHRARERAARHRQAQRAAGILVAPSEAAGSLPEVDPALHGEVLNDQMRTRAREEVRDFKRELRAEARQGPQEKSKRQKDSARRKKIKKERRKERKKNSRDDAERDSNHAIAHDCLGTGSRYATGFLVAASTVASAEAKGGEDEESPCFLELGFLFVTFIFACVMAQRLMRQQVIRPDPERRVGGRKRRVKFEDARAPAPPPPTGGEIPFLGGPATAVRLHPAGRPLRFAEIQGREEWRQESLALLVDRYAKSTIEVYKNQFKWWELFCTRRGLDPIRVKGSYNREEEQIFLDFILHCALNEQKAPGTVKIRLAAVRSYHLTLGLPDPTQGMPRIPLP